MSPRVLAEVLRARAASDGERLAFDDGTARITFGELAERAAVRARALARLGVGPGDRVALSMSAGVAFAEVFWGLQLLGAVPTAFDPDTREPARSRRIAVVRPRLTVDDALAAELADEGGPLPEAGVGPDAIAFVQPTSGTSGTPRGAQIRHRNVLSFLAANHAAGHIGPDDVLVAWVPPWHDLGLVWFVIGAVYHGASCHVVQPAISTIPAWLRTIDRVGGTVSGAPDFCWRLACRMVDPTTVDLRSLRALANGGEPVRRSSIVAFEEHFGVTGIAQPGYGLAEATLGVTAHRVGTPLAVDARGNVSSGVALPGIELRAGADASAPGEILVRAGSVFAGYFDAPDDTAQRLRDGWLHTGDSGYLDADGRLFVLGRRQAMIKRAGVVVAPRELEEAAQEVSEVRVAAAVGYDRPDGREAIALVVEADVTADRVAALAGDVTRAVVAWAGFAPDRVEVAPRGTVPRTGNGKIRHARLRAMLLDGLVPPVPTVPTAAAPTSSPATATAAPTSSPATAVPTTAPTVPTGAAPANGASGASG